MKMLIICSVLAIVFTSCGTLISPEMQYERESLIEAYDAARQKHNPESVKEAVKDLLIGKWQYVGLEVEKGSVTAQRVSPMSQRTIDASTSSTTVVSKGTTNEQATTPTASEHAEAQDLPNREADVQTPKVNAPRLSPIEVTDEESNQRILVAKAALVASTRKNLTIEFSEDRGSYHYSGSNRGTNVTGQCSITTKRYGDDPLPFISFNRRTGPKMLEFLFGSEPINRWLPRRNRRMQREDVEWEHKLDGEPPKKLPIQLLPSRDYGDGGHAVFSPLRGYGINTTRVDANRGTAMHFQTDRIKTETLMLFYILILVFAGCTPAKHQQMQNERDILREAYEDAQRKDTSKRSRDFLSDDMLGKWRFRELVVEERGGSEDILKVKAARTARRLKGLTLRFWKTGDAAYNYQIEKMMTKTHGTYTTRAVHREG